MGVKFVFFKCSLCGRRFRVEAKEIDRLIVSREGVDCKHCNKHLELVVLDA